MRLDKVSISKLRKHVYHGLYAEIARETGHTRSAVMNVLNGKWYNQDILDVAIRLIEQNKLKVTSIKEKISKL